MEGSLISCPVLWASTLFAVPSFGAAFSAVAFAYPEYYKETMNGRVNVCMSNEVK